MPRLDRRDVILGGLLVAATVFAYWPAVYGTLLWDDAGHVTRPDLRSLHGLWRIWFDIGATQQYYPLLHSAFWIEHRLWGDHVFGYHLANIVQHAWSALVLWAILARLRLPGGWLAAWIFALHPMQVESVAWISEQKNTLSTALYLTSAFVYLGFDRTRARRDYLLAAGLFAAAVSSKTTTVTLPVALLVVLWWQRGALDPRRDVRPLVPWFLLAAAGGAVTSWFEYTYIGAAGEGFALGLLERVLLAGRVIVFYASTLLWPADLMFNYPRWDVDAGRWWQYLFAAGVGVALLVAWRWRGRARGPLASLLLFVGALSPALGFVNVFPFVYAYVADHFAYLATSAVVAPAAWILARAPGRWLAWTRAGRVPIAGVLIVVVLGWMTRHESAVFKDVDTLYRTTIARNPGSWMAYENLGVLLAGVPGRLEEAAGMFEAVVRLRPDRTTARRNLALALARLPGREAQAVAAYEALVRMPDARARDHVDFARLLERVPGREQEAVRHLRRALEVNPSSATAHYALATALADRDQPDAEAEYRRAVALDPDFVDAYVGLGNFLLRQPGREAEARANYRVSLRLRPDFVEAHYNLGTALLEVPGRNLDAVSHLTAAVRLRPDDPRARTNLAIALTDQPGRTDDAIRHLEAAIRLAPDLRQPRELLGLLRASGGELQ